MIVIRSQRMIGAIQRRWIWLICVMGTVIAFWVASRWFVPGHLAAGGDIFPSTLIQPQLWVPELYSSWDPTVGLGGPSEGPSHIPQVLLSLLLRLALSPAQAQFASYALLFAGQFLAMLFFALTIMPGQRLVACVAAVFYCFNIFTTVTVTGQVYMCFLVLWPVTAALIIRILQRGATIWNLTAFVLIVSPLGFVANNPPLVVFFTVSNAIIAVYLIVRQRSQLWSALRWVALMAALAILANLYWLLPQYAVLFGSGHQQINAVTSAQDWAFATQRSSILNLFWLNPIWAWNYHNPVYIPYARSYSAPLLEAAVFVPTLLAFSALLNTQIPRRLAVLMAAAALVLVFVSTGVQSPWPSMTIFLYQHMPLFWLFREPDNKFPLVVLALYAPLIGYQCVWLARRLANAVRHWTATRTLVQLASLAFLCAIFVVTAFPLVTGAAMSDRPFYSTEKTFSNSLTIPQYWFSLSDYLARHDPQSPILILPNDDFYMMPYKWGFYGSDVVGDDFIPNPTVILTNDQAAGGYLSASFSYDEFKRHMLEILKSGRGAIAPYLAAQGIRYILQRNDIDDKMPGRDILKAQNIRSYLRAQPDVHFVRSFGQLDLYEVDDNHYLPPVYAIPVSRDDVMRQDVQGVVNRAVVAALGLPAGTVALGARPRVVTSRPAVVRLSWHQDGPARLTVHVPALHGPILLVYSAIYNPGWHACLVPANGTPPPWSCWFSGFLPARAHVQPLGFMNGWLIDHPGQYTLILDYGFQHTVDLALLLSTVTIVGSVVLLFGSRIKRLWGVAVASPAAVGHSGEAAEEEGTWHMESMDIQG